MLYAIFCAFIIVGCPLQAFNTLSYHSQKHFSILDKGLSHLKKQNPQAVIDLFEQFQNDLDKQSHKFQFIAYLEMSIAAIMLDDPDAVEQYFITAMDIAEWELLHNPLKIKGSISEDQHMTYLSDELFVLLHQIDQSSKFDKNGHLLQMKNAREGLLSRIWQKNFKLDYILHAMDSR